MAQKEEKLTYTVSDIKSILGIGHNKAYELIHRKGFPVVKIGKSYLIPKDKFHEWINEEAERGLYGGDEVDIY